MSILIFISFIIIIYVLFAGYYHFKWKKEDKEMDKILKENIKDYFKFENEYFMGE